VTNITDINRQTGYQAETAVAINPTDPNQMFAWSNNLASATNSAAFTTNGGVTWAARVTGGDGWPALGGDPTCSFDSFGNLYAASFNSGFSSILIKNSTNSGQTFNSTSLLTITGAGLDQPTVKAGPGVGGANQSIWITHRTSAGLIARGAAVNGFNSFGAFGAALTIPGSSSGNFGDIAIGPNGQVAVTYQTPSGGSGPSTIQVAVNATGNTAGSFVMSAGAVPTNVGGFRTIPAQPSRSVDSEVGLAYDNSNGPHRGRLHMVYTDAPTTASNDLNIFTRFSDDNGATWSAPHRVNTDVGTNSQFFSKIALDPTTGNVAVVWYDARNSATNNRVELWGTVSTDGGMTFQSEVKISGAGSTSGVGLGSGNELGDYLGLDFYNNVFYPVWGDNSNSDGNNPNGTANLDFYGARVTLTGVPEPTSLALAGLTLGGGLAWRRRRAQRCAKSSVITA
jgi:hypothetical protein